MFERVKDVTRMDYGKTHGWNVRISFEGKIYRKLFSDKQHGGKNCALLAAISYRDDLRKKLGKPATSKKVVTKANNSTGVVGVYLNKKNNKFEVFWKNHLGKTGHTNYSIAKHGKQKAFELAVAKRQQKEHERLHS